MTNRRDPFEEIEELFERMRDGIGTVGGELETQVHGIDVDVADEGDDVVVTADLPGFEQSDIDVTVENRRLRIAAEQEGEREEEGEAEQRQFYRRERRSKSVGRTVKLPVEVVEQDATATYENGVLTVTLPKATTGETGHSIEIN